MEAVEGDQASPTQQQPSYQQEIANTTPTATPPSLAVSVSRVNVVPADSVENGVGHVSPALELQTVHRKEEEDDQEDDGVEGLNIQRKWKFFPGKNRFYCDGRVMTAPSIRFCILSFALILVTFTLFIIFE